jgi:hypothetical protein
VSVHSIYIAHTCLYKLYICLGMIQLGSYQEHGISLCDIITSYGICHCCLICTALVIGMFYAIVQELVILYIEVSDCDRPPRNG